MAHCLEQDLNHILELTPDLWQALRNQRCFITGGTGFFGCWLLESFIWANEHYDLNATACVLTRNAAAFRAKAPHLAHHPAIRLHTGDVRSFEFPAGSFDFIMHAATEASATINQADPLLLLDTIVEGTRHTLEFARHCGARKFLLTSSGAVYGRQPPTLTHVTEDYTGAPITTDTRSAYGEGKRLAEFLCSSYHHVYGIETKIARCFAFVGPHLPLNGAYAIGNFMRDGLAGEPIHVAGDGTPYRSYLYAADLAVWLWTILLRGTAGRPYNVGSEQAVTISDLARSVATACTPQPAVQIAQQPAQGQVAERYVPSVQRAITELGLRQTIDLKEAIRRSIVWYAAT